MVEKTLNIIDQIKWVLLILYTEHNVAFVLNSIWTKMKARELVTMFFEKYCKD